MSDPLGGFRTVGPALDLPPDWVEPYLLPDLDLRLCVARVNGTLYATGDLCGCGSPAYPFSAGPLDGGALLCRTCGSRFDPVTGEPLRGPVTRPVPTFVVREEAGEFQILL